MAVSDVVWSMPGDVARSAVPEPPEDQNAEAWAACAAAVPTWLLPPEPYAMREGGWYAMLAMPAGRNAYASAWQRLDPDNADPDPSSPGQEREGAGGKNLGSGFRSMASALESIAGAGGVLKGFLRQEWQNTLWQSNVGKTPLRFVLGLAIAGQVYTLFDTQGSAFGFIGTLSNIAVPVLALTYLFRHVPTESHAPRCESCGALWAGRPLCSSCKRRVRDPEGSPAYRRSWRSF